jgi:hypothetical protein
MTQALTLRNRGIVLVGAYLLVVTTLTIGHGFGWPAIHQVALTPRFFAEGKLWLLAASGFLADTNSTEALMLSITGIAVLAIYLRSTRRFVHAAVFGHVGATVLTYAGIGVLLLAHVDAMAGVVDEPDYGISCVFAGALGAAAVQGWREPRRLTRIAVTSGTAFALAAMTVTATGLALPEHIIAFLLGGVVVASDRSSPVGRSVAS